jgi:hypothetical protein
MAQLVGSTPGRYPQRYSGQVNASFRTLRIDERRGVSELTRGVGRASPLSLAFFDLKMNGATNKARANRRIVYEPTSLISKGLLCHPNSNS